MGHAARIPTPEVRDSDFGAFEEATAQVDKARALAHYQPMAAQAVLLPILQAVDPVVARWERRVSKPAEFEVQHGGATWFVRMECDSFDGDVGPRASDWWLSAVKIGRTWFDAQDTLAAPFIADLEQAARKTPE